MPRVVEATGDHQQGSWAGKKEHDLTSSQRAKQRRNSRDAWTKFESLIYLFIHLPCFVLKFRN